MPDEQKINKQEFSTLDIYFAAYLNIKGLDCEPRKSEHGKVMFIFNKEEAFAGMDDYNSRETLIPIVEFVRQVKFLRGLMNQMR
jgi:hypothetical protein